MMGIALYYGDITQLGLVVVSAVLAAVSVRAYRRRQEARYVVLMLAFILLCVGSVSTAVLELFVRAGPSNVLFVETYVNPSLELLMGLSFLAAVFWSFRAD